MLRYGSNILAVSWPIAGPLFLALSVIFLITFLADPAPADEVADGEAEGFSEEKLSFKSGDVTLSAVVLIPHITGQKPALALVHGVRCRARPKRGVS